MGAEAAVGILHRKRLAAAAYHERDALKDHLVAEHVRIAGGADRAMAIGVLDELFPGAGRGVASPRRSPPPGQPGQHGNIPCDHARSPGLQMVHITIYQKFGQSLPARTRAGFRDPGQKWAQYA